jgi:hypothetical protein
LALELPWTLSVVPVGAVQLFPEKLPVAPWKTTSWTSAFVEVTEGAVTVVPAAVDPAALTSMGRFGSTPWYTARTAAWAVELVL